MKNFKGNVLSDVMEKNMKKKGKKTRKELATKES